MATRSLVVCLMAGAALVLPACGSEDKKSTTESKSSTTATTTKAVIAHVAATRAALDAAVKQLEAGNAKQAEEIVAEAYLQEFELVEGPLDKVDHELNEQLEESISAELRNKIKSGASVAEVKALVNQIKTNLDAAEQKLGG